MPPNVDVHASLRTYFDQGLRSAARATRVSISDEVIFYLTHLLSERAVRGLAMEGPLAFELASAERSEAPEARVPRLRAVGDAALYQCGFFPEHVTKKGVSHDYVVAMGRRAYGAAETLAAGHGGARHPFGELAREFIQLAALLDEVREKTSLRSDDDIVHLCDRFRATGSPTVGARLLAAGVLPQLTSLVTRGLA